jgi:NAD(P)-dependent dehydrogenase (short-subunit alcohol dehydrogenase family)
MDYGLKDKTALIVGGATGIGFAAAKLMAQEGMRVAVVDINGDAANAAAAKLSATGVKSIGVRADITRLDDVAAMVQNVEQNLGTIDVLVNSAAVLDDKLFLESTPQDWDRMIKVCLNGPMNVLHAVLPGMVARKFGRVICLASDSARIGQARLSYYAAAKAGVIALVKSLAQEVGAHGVTLNVVSPGATNTELRQKREESLKTSMGEEKYAKRVQTVLKMYPTRRIGEPDDIASAITYLASVRASWVTGQVLSVNGGFVML